MPFDAWLLFAGAVIALAMAPVSYGVSSVAVGGVGRILACAVMIAVTATGLGMVLAVMDCSRMTA